MNLLAYVHLRNIHGSTGAGRVARLLTEQLAQRADVRLRVLADQSDHRRVIPHVGAPWNGFEYHFFREETSRQQARWFFLQSPAAEHYWPEAQVTYCTAESYVPTKKSRLAVTVHDAAVFEPNVHRQDWGLWKQRWKWRLLYGQLGRKADLFHTVSQFSADRLSHYFPAIRERLRVVHNAVAPHFLQPPTEEGRRFLVEQKLLQHPYVLLPGGLHFRKNADLVLTAWPRLQQRVPELQLVVVNHSDPAYAAHADALGSSVRRMGFVSDDALCALYSAAQVVWFPSRYEGFGMPVVEAMACGAPVVASHAASLPEIASDAAVLVDPHQPAEHIEAIEALWRNAPERERLSRLGRERAERFTWERAGRELHSHLAALV